MCGRLRVRGAVNAPPCGARRPLSDGPADANIVVVVFVPQNIFVSLVKVVGSNPSLFPSKSSLADERDGALGGVHLAQSCADWSSPTALARRFHTED
jgi:hypothetical protein